MRSPGPAPCADELLVRVHSGCVAVETDHEWPAVQPENNVELTARQVSAGLSYRASRVAYPVRTAALAMARASRVPSTTTTLPYGCLGAGRGW